MGKRRGTISLYYGFIGQLGTASARRRITPLQFAGKLEDFLVKEFVSYIYHASNGLRFAEVNPGRRGQQKIDIAILRPGRTGPDLVEAFIEAKYLRNRHRRSANHRDAMDEVSSTFRDLKRQLAWRPGKNHGFHNVKLAARTPHLYGLVFASYTRRDAEPDTKEDCYSEMLTKAAKYGLRYHDLDKPYWRSAYEDEPLDILGESWKASLRLGLWRL